VVQENELTALAKAVDAGDFHDLDRGMIRLNQNTQAVEGEARSAGQQSRRIARALDRAADSQGSAVSALRAQPVAAADAETAENRSLELLNEALQLAQELQKQTQEEDLAQRRGELIEKYRALAEQQIAVRAEAVELAQAGELDRRQLVEARRLGAAQDDIRAKLSELRDTVREITEALVFSHTHRLMQEWSVTASESLSAGKVDVEVTDRQQMIAEAIGGLIDALEESMLPPEEFAKEQNQGQQGEGGQQGQQPQPLIPPVAELKLLQGLQQQIYDQTRSMDSRRDLDEAQRRNRLREVGQQQRELMGLGQQMLEKLQQGQAPTMTPGDPSTPPEPSPEPEPDPVPQT
jgi:hypothetical protein